jgi:uncharacterized OsmC-like protein
MYGTLAGALSGRKIPFDRNQFTATAEGRIVGVGKTIRITSIALHYTIVVPPEHREATERALRVHPAGCPAHESVKDAIAVTWEAEVRCGDEIISIHS